ncbi:MAG: hypothetical protein LBM04_10530 [Opitutaceae bacterium]|nr:hypothetical protein [Opitutaceae bacterium]
MSQHAKTTLYWIIGIATAFGGVAIVRLVAPRYAEKTAAYLSAGGQLMALMGLVVIAFGVRQRVWQKRAENLAPDTPDTPDSSARSDSSDRSARSDSSVSSARSDHSA